ncbi:MAG TPA: zf-HC2 domain-containing protein [Thermoanaerobaculia bacterium]|nr:zf-HC2 domain-containing protein [Thermoanaerobaculia bacterium]
MSLSCAQVRGRFEEYAAEALSTQERRDVRAHLGACASCRAEAVASDPVFLFSGSGTAAVSSEEAAGILEAVRTGIAFKQAERKLEPPARRRRWSALASAAAALALTLVAPGPPAPREAPVAAGAQREAVGTDFVPAAGPARAEEFLQKTGGAQRYPADATIYDWNPGAGQPRVVWIVDRSIDI